MILFYNSNLSFNVKYQITILYTRKISVNLDQISFIRFTPMGKIFETMKPLNDFLNTAIDNRGNQFDDIIVLQIKLLPIVYFNNIYYCILMKLTIQLYQYVLLYITKINYTFVFRNQCDNGTKIGNRKICSRAAGVDD